VFTLDARLVQRFAEADRTIISSLAFAEPPTAQVSLPVLQPAGGPGSPSESGTAEPPKSP
jgi:hypothetical protein